MPGTTTAIHPDRFLKGSPAEPRIATHIEGVGALIDEIARRVATLSDRLSPVLSPSPPSAASKDNGIAHLSASPHALQLHGLAGQLQAVLETLGDLTDRLEI